MSARGALAVALLVIVALIGFAAFLTGVPLAGVLLGSVIAAIIIAWTTSRYRRKKEPEGARGPN